VIVTGAAVTVTVTVCLWCGFLFLVEVIGSVRDLDETLLDDSAAIEELPLIGILNEELGSTDRLVDELTVVVEAAVGRSPVENMFETVGAGPEV
jgi:hypothetical protein